MKFIFLAIFMILLILGIVVYVGIRAWQVLSWSKIFRIIFISIFLLAFISFFVSFFLMQSSFAYSYIIQVIGFTWLIAVFYALFPILLVDIFRFISKYVDCLKYFINRKKQMLKPLLFGVITIPMFVIFCVGYNNYSNIEISKVDIDLEKISDSDVLNAVFVSDLHIGKMIGKERLELFVEKINDQNPDVIFFVGDIFTDKLEVIKTQNLQELFSKINSKYGIYAVYGNHEYYEQYVKSEDSQEYLKTLPITFLKDTVVTIADKYCVIGRDDYTNKSRRLLPEILQRANKQMPIILLDHQPYNLGESYINGIDLQLSGHTHNGQIFPLNLIIDKIYELGYGYKKKGNTHYYVSSGLGLWGPPYRIGSKSEIVNIKIH